MKFDYKSLKEAREKFNWKDMWETFSKNRNELNIAYECVDRHPKENIAVRLQNSNGSRNTYTFGELSKWTSQFANWLKDIGINTGDRVAIVLNPSLEYYISFFGILKRGAVVVPCYSLLGLDGITYRFESANVKIAVISEERKHIIPKDLVDQIITSEELFQIIENKSSTYEPDTSADSLAIVQFSSGTTGQPKPVLYKHMAMAITSVYVKLWIGLRKSDNYMCISSPAWGHGIWYGTVGPLVYGNAVGSYSGKFIPEILLEGLEKFGITVVSFIPRVYKEIMNCGKIDNYNLKLRRLTYAGDAIDKKVVWYFKDKLNIGIGSCYGNTESGPIVLDYPYDDYKEKLGSAGKPFLGNKVAILGEDDNKLPDDEIGEIAIWRNEKWFRIGDYGHLDKDGYLFVKGRSDDIIKSSGYRIGPFEIENTLEKHPSVKKAVVIGSPDIERGEIVKAFIILEDKMNESADLVKELQTFVKENLSLHEYPKEIEFVDTVPETPDGKLQRKKLKQLEYERKKTN